MTRPIDEANPDLDEAARAVAGTECELAAARATHNACAEELMRRMCEAGVDEHTTRAGLTVRLNAKPTITVRRPPKASRRLP